ncbi:MAG: DUF1834 family protein [Deltaproteobacteria bacterium]|nr:DUF1834 family protein [Deltaproteobacteria bacterium]
MDSDSELDFETVEDAIINAVRREMPDLKTVKNYAGELEENDLKKMTFQFPAAFIIYRNSVETWVDGQTFNEKATFAVFFASKNFRGDEKVRKDTKKGIYKFLKKGMEVLTNKTFGLDIERLAPTRKYLVFTSKEWAAYGIDFVTNFDTNY